MASTFLTDCASAVTGRREGVSRLHEGRMRRLDIVFLVGAALLAMVVVGIVAEAHPCSPVACGSRSRTFSPAHDQFSIPPRVARRHLPCPGARCGDRCGVIDRGVVGARQSPQPVESLRPDRTRTTSSGNWRASRTRRSGAGRHAIDGRLTNADVGVIAVRREHGRVSATVDSLQEGRALVTGVLGSKSVEARATADHGTGPSHRIDVASRDGPA